MPIKVVYVRIQDPAYPRNRSIREALESDGRFVLAPVEKSHESSRIRRVVRDLVRLWRHSRGADLLLLSEMNVSWALPVWVVARVRRASVVVDFFVGLYETAVEDWRNATPRSLSATRYRVLDSAALNLADLLLSDNSFRAREWARRSRGPVSHFPVGAPSWATTLPRNEHKGPLRVLYYGNYIPLHGLDLVVDALDLERQRTGLEVVFIGDGPGRARVVEDVRARGMDDLVSFQDSVAESELREQIGWSDVVLGVFGDSPKARSVIANKVWQGLASGRVVVTQDSPALDDIRAVAGELLVPVAPGSPRALADALNQLARRLPPENSQIDDALQGLVQVDIRRTVNAVAAASSSRLRARRHR